MDILNMYLNEIIEIENKRLQTAIIRVPGGWIYRSHDIGHGRVTMLFVPEVPLGSKQEG